MNTPSFYDAAKVGELYPPNIMDAVRAGAATDATPASMAQVRTMLLLVDCQVDFVHPEGNLYVPGAVEDTQRTIEWIFRNLSRLTTIAASLDSHVPIQIFFQTWWENDDGGHPEPYTVIRSEDIESGKWKALHEPDWSVEYVRMLEANAKKELMIWPYHCLIGTPGHALMPALYEAIAYHSAARRTSPIFLEKGMIPKTEHYSMLEPEVKVPDNPNGELNIPFLNMLSSYDRIFIAGQAESHCVLETVTSIMRYFDDQPRIIEKFCILLDAMSPVAHPTIDFGKLARRQFEKFEAKGLRVAETSQLIR